MLTFVNSAYAQEEPHDAPPEGELHAHDYRFDVVVARGELDEHGMVCDLDVLRATMQAMAIRTTRSAYSTRLAPRSPRRRRASRDGW